jgi:membrane fusion protein (multidrug efflux system)
MNIQRATFALLALILAGVIVSGCKDRSAEAPRTISAQPVAVRLVQPKHGSISRSITLPAEIKANQQATLYAKVTGYLKSIVVDKGDVVKEGALLAEIEVPELLADTAKYKAEVELANVEYRRISEAQTKAPDLVVPLTVDTAKSRLDVARANLERAETLLKFTKIVAPFSGVVTRRTVDVGAFIPTATAGSAQSAALLTLADFNTVRIQVAVPEAEVPLIAKGRPIKVSVEEIPGCSFDGSVTRFAYTLDDITKTMLLEAELPNPKWQLRPGMYAIAKVFVEQRNDALLIPADALVVEKLRNSVFVMVDGKAKKIPVKTGFNDGGYVEIVEGVTPEQSVILIGKQVLVDGQPVLVIGAK